MKKKFKISFKEILTLKNLFRVGIFVLIVAFLGFGFWTVKHFINEGSVVRKINLSLKAKPHKAQILIKANTLDEKSGKIKTTIKFQELNANTQTIGSQMFTFEGSELEVGTLVVPINKDMLKNARGFRGGKALLFMKMVVKDEKGSKEFDLIQPNAIPLAYQIKESEDPLEKTVWNEIWKEILDEKGNLKSKLKMTAVPLSTSYFLPGTIFDLSLDASGKVTIETKHPSYWRSERE